MAGNRIKQNIESPRQRKSPLTSAGKAIEELEEKEIAISEKENTEDISLNNQHVNNVNKESVKEKEDETNVQIKPNTTKQNIESEVDILEEQPKNNTKKKTPQKTEDDNFGFIIEKRGEPDIKKQKMYNLKLGNIKKIKELAIETGISESALIDFLIEKGTDILKIK